MYKQIGDIEVKYIDGENVETIVDTKDQDWKDKIKEKIEGDYFKIKYDYGNDYKIEKETILKSVEKTKNAVTIEDGLIEGGLRNSCYRSN